MYSLSEASTLQRPEQNFVLSSSRLPQYDRLAVLGHDWFVIFYNLLIKTIFTGDWLNFHISIALTCCTHASVESSETSEPSW